MIPTLLVGDHVFSDKLVYRFRHPKRGEVMIFAFPSSSIRTS
jgi:signal peptidase I